MIDNSIIAAYAAYSLDRQERLASSSGGVFSLLAKRILEDGGAVYGVAMSEDCRRAEYVRVEDAAQLGCLRGSKYLQAYMGNAYANVREDLKNGISVLFTGTGCQINGLKFFLTVSGCDDGRLYCVDVICHGVPSPALWRKYVDYIETSNHARLIRVNFRCKDKGWTDFGMKEIDEEHREMFISKDTDPFMQMFLRDYCLRPSCYECKVRGNKLSDLTIADFWGIENVAPEMTDGNGTSFVLVRSERGKELWESVRNLLCIKEVSYEDGVRWNPAEYKSAARPPQRHTFFADMHGLTFDEQKTRYAAPIKPSFQQRVKRKIKKAIINNTILHKLYNIYRGGYRIAPPMDYGLYFELEMEQGRV